MPSYLEHVRRDEIEGNVLLVFGMTAPQGGPTAQFFINGKQTLPG